MVGPAPPGNGADCSAPARVVSLTGSASTSARRPASARHELTSMATVTRLASSPSVCAFRTSGPPLTARADQATVLPPGTGKPT